MKANCWFGKHDVRVCEVPEPQLLSPRDAIVRVTLTTICGSDLHLYDGHVPSMQEGDILGHEFMGEVVSVGSGVENLRPGDRVVVPFAISCGRCATTRTRMPPSPPPCTGSRARACSATRT
jgi:threonine dehydrogenase-like Zn-dependent dehydrogenase